MPPAKSWTPSSAPPDSGEGTREAPHGYRPWPNSGRDEPAVPANGLLRRPSPPRSPAPRWVDTLESALPRGIKGSTILVLGEDSAASKELTRRGAKLSKRVKSCDAVLVVALQSSVDPARLAKRARLIVDACHIVPDGPNVIRV